MGSFIKEKLFRDTNQKGSAIQYGELSSDDEAGCE
jgi:hypothetical protein